MRNLADFDSGIIRISVNMSSILIIITSLTIDGIMHTTLGETKYFEPARRENWERRNAILLLS